MSRLYGVKVDEKRWKITEIDNIDYHTYKLINKEKEEIYILKHIIGLEQITEDEFLVYDRYNRDSFRIARYKAENSCLIKLFEKTFSYFYFITEDRILFAYTTKSGVVRCSDIYSIEDNNYVEDGEWLNNAVINMYNYNKPDELKIYVENEIISSKLGIYKILFTVDPNTLQPNSACFSQLRDKYIKTTSKEDIKKIESEDIKYISIIEDYMCKQDREQLKKAKEYILARKNESM